MAASHDGTVAFFEFDARAFKGRPLVSKVEFSAIAQNNGMRDCVLFASAGVSMIDDCLLFVQVMLFSLLVRHYWRALLLCSWRKKCKRHRRRKERQW